MQIDDSTLIVLLVLISAVIVVVATVFAVRRRMKKPPESPSDNQRSDPIVAEYPYRLQKSVPSQDASRAKDELRLLDLERGILSDAIRRLYEAHAEGKISETERERLAQTYKTRMMTVKDAITKDESLVALHELEAMQEDLMKLFNERFEELGTKIEELRSRTSVEPIKEIAITPKLGPIEDADEEETEGKGQPEERVKRRRRAPSAKPSPRTEAEKRIEEIRAEVEKVLDKLGQMEIES